MDPSDELIELSGDAPDTVILPGDSADSIPLLRNDTTLPGDFILIKPAHYAFSTNYYHISLMALKSVLTLFMFILTFVTRRDFYRVFVLLLASLMLVDLCVDTFVEVKAHVDQLGSSEFKWEYVLVPMPINESIVYQQSHAGQIFISMLSIYTTYTIYDVIWWLPPISYLILSTLFWQLLISSTVVFYYLHRAVVNPTEIVYANYIPTFLKFFVLSVILSGFNTLLSFVEMPHYILYLAISVLLRAIVAIFYFTLLTQIFASFFLFLRLRGESANCSAYAFVRHSKSRLFFFLFFACFVLILAFPYAFWSCISLADDFLRLTGLSRDSLPIPLASACFQHHIFALILRPYVIPFLVLLFLVPYRNTFFKIFCPCLSK